jgi:hypothetical protein
VGVVVVLATVEVEGAVTPVLYVVPTLVVFVGGAVVRLETTDVIEAVTCAIAFEIMSPIPPTVDGFAVGDAVLVATTPELNAPETAT